VAGESEEADLKMGYHPTDEDYKHEGKWWVIELPGGHRVVSEFTGWRFDVGGQPWRLDEVKVIKQVDLGDPPEVSCTHPRAKEMTTGDGSIVEFCPDCGKNELVHVPFPEMEDGDQ
jgi:hypothetical protein